MDAFANQFPHAIIITNTNLSKGVSMKLNYVFLALLIFFGQSFLSAKEYQYSGPRQAYYSNNPQEEKKFLFKAERRDKERRHRELLKAYLAHECPKNGEFSLLQKLVYAQWVSECRNIDQEIEESKEILSALDKKIDQLKN